MMPLEKLLAKITLGTSLLLIVLFFLHLVIVNSIDRNGIEIYAKASRDIERYTETIHQLEYEIATHSSLDLVEKRAAELGLKPADKVEYIR